MATARLTREESRQRTRSQLLAAARRLFAKQGFYATSIEDIVAAAGYTRGAFYGNFADKEDLFLTIIEQRTADQLSDYRAIDTLPMEERPAALQRWFDAVTSADDELAGAFAEFLPTASRDRKHRGRLRADTRAFRSAITASVDQFGRELGTGVPLPSEQIATMLLAIGDGLAAQRRLDPHAVPSELFEAAINLFWFGIIAAQRSGTRVEDVPERLRRARASAEERDQETTATGDATGHRRSTTQQSGDRRDLHSQGGR